MQLLLQFHVDSDVFLPADARGNRSVGHYSRKPQFKDAIEACGIPHAEVDLILCDGFPVGFCISLP